MDTLSLVYGDPLTPLEHDVIATLVRPAHPLMNAFREQLAVCRIKSRELTGVGFFTHIVVPQRLAVAAVGKLILSDVAAELDGVQHGAGFVLFIEDGMLDVLEGFTYDEPWPDRVEGFAVRSLTSTDFGGR